MLEAVNITLDYLKEPCGLMRLPEIGWELACLGHNILQSGYRIQISERRDFGSLLYDTGMTDGQESTNIKLPEIPLKSLTRYFLRVMVRNNLGEVSKFSEPVSFVTALLQGVRAGCFLTIEEEKDAKSAKGSYIRKAISVKRKVRSAYVCATALGLYHLYLDGKEAGEAQLAPGWTSYHKRLRYQIYDVTEKLSLGEHVLGVSLGAGWYKGTFGFYGTKNLYGPHTAFWGQLHILYEDGSREVILTDESWEGHWSPVTDSEIYNGEQYDARKELPGWNLPGNEWVFHKVRTIPFPLEVLEPQPGGFIRKMEERKAERVFETPKGETCIDFGQNMTGWVRIKVQGQRGDRLRLHFFEALDKDGNAYFENLRDAKQTDTYICSGRTGEYQPFFTFHGFRYVRVESWNREIKGEEFVAVAIYSEMEAGGVFRCSNPLVNQLCANTVWSMKSNFLDIPMDCPQRDERLGWTGDAQIFSGTAMYLMNCFHFFEKWMRDVALEQNEEGGIPHVVPDIITGHVSKGDLFEEGTQSASGWADAAVIIPWNLYLHYGSCKLLENQFASMKAWIDFMYRHSRNYEWSYQLQFGDWVALDAYKGSYFGATPIHFTNMAYFAYVTRLFVKIAKRLDKKDIIPEYEAMCAGITKAFQNKYFDADGTLNVRTQTAHVLALYFELMPEQWKQKTAKNLVSLLEREGGHLVTGFMGTPYLCFALGDNGYVKEAYQLLLREEFPSWLYQINMGATTIWEHWDGMREDGSMWDAEMNSFNHYAYGSVVEWLFRRVAGIELEEPHNGSPRRFRIEPCVCKALTEVEASYHSRYGLVKSAWTINGNVVTLKIVIPNNTQAALVVHGKVIESEGELRFMEKDGVSEAVAGSGDYTVSYRIF